MKRAPFKREMRIGKRPVAPAPGLHHCRDRAPISTGVSLARETAGAAVQGRQAPMRSKIPEFHRA